jgi:hypothetical protein
VRKRVGKEVAHMTYHRTKIAEEAKLWRYAAIWQALAGVLLVFVEQASFEPLPKDVARRIVAVATPKRDIVVGAATAASGTNAIPQGMTSTETMIGDGGPGTATYMLPG